MAWCPLGTQSLTETMYCLRRHKVSLSCNHLTTVATTDPWAQATGLDHFCTIGERLSHKLPSYGNDYQKYITYNIRDSFAILPVDDNHILREIRNLSPNKAPGSDNIGSKLLKLDPLSFCYPLRKIFNKSIEMDKYPDGMKLAKVVPIFKKGHMYISDNYRPLSLLSVFKRFLKRFCTETWWSSLRATTFYLCINSDIINYVQLQ